MNRLAVATDGFARPLSNDLIATDGFIEAVTFHVEATRYSRPSSTTIVRNYGVSTVRHNRSEGVVRQ